MLVGFREFWHSHGGMDASPDALLSYRLLAANFLTRRWFRTMGAFSFSLYIVHFPIVVLISSVLFHSVKQTSLAPFFLVLAVVVGCAYLFSLVCERPALALSHRFKNF